ncbi:flagellar motor switch protein FliN/FliY [Persephonella hydrogeniphila]|uniref:Flagellar motor switch protein FliN n=1 Tax=Persephonella hydrogeniphila TaxID=198703 RepID=A0A285NJT7_9AQUI|nr:flagellar motor switch protein FliN [Persephonella hydrogeniphila]SNZ08136.1 flagellar motor switch protein FliN/FliY [Persephonella hydrogeniphila]
MSEEEKKENEPQENEEVDQEKLAEEWAKMAEQSQPEEEKGEEEVDQEKLAEEWAKMAEGEGGEEETGADQEELAKQWEEAVSTAEHKPEETELLEKEKLDLLMDIPLEISVEIGSTTMPLEEVLKLNPNSIVELDRYINQPIDIKVNGKLIAKGELYTVENNFGVKITSIITVQERMKLLTEEES